MYFLRNIRLGRCDLCPLFNTVSLPRYIENVFPGEFGIPQKWYYPFTPTYWGFCKEDLFTDLVES